MKEKLKKLNDYEWELNKTVRDKMRFKAKIIANTKILQAIEDNAIEQLTNVACLPGVIEPVIGLPDMHWGYGLPMGAVSAFDEKEGIISSGLCGFDINCGVNSIRTNLTYSEIKDKLKGGDLDDIDKFLPSGGAEIKRASSKKSFFTLITSQSIHSWRQTAILRKAKCPTGSPKGASPPRLRHEWIASFYRFLYFLDEA